MRPGTGIGMRNVRERMKVLYGDLGTVVINSRPGRGTQVRLLMPILETGAEAWSSMASSGGESYAGFDAARSTTRS